MTDSSLVSRRHRDVQRLFCTAVQVTVSRSLWIGHWSDVVAAGAPRWMIGEPCRPPSVRRVDRISLIHSKHSRPQSALRYYIATYNRRRHRRWNHAYLRSRLAGRRVLNNMHRYSFVISFSCSLTRAPPAHLQFTEQHRDAFIYRQCIYSP